MKKEYLCPEFKKFEVTLKDVLAGSIEDEIPETIGGDNPDPSSDPLEGF